jgi:ubiquinone/menaquinone biosynthesis C-methylase UbiE
MILSLCSFLKWGSQPLNTTYPAKVRFQNEAVATNRRMTQGASNLKVIQWAMVQVASLAQTGTVLDLACGNGRHFVDLEDVCRSLIAGDLSGPMLKIAQETSKELSVSHHLVRFDAERLPFSDKSFDVVFCARFFHHLPSPELRERILAEAFRVSRKGVIFTCKQSISFEHLRQLLKALRHGKIRIEGRYYLSRREVCRIAQKHGWQITHHFAPHPYLAANHAYRLEPAPTR